jgi:hypothetical protein
MSAVQLYKTVRNDLLIAAVVGAVALVGFCKYAGIDIDPMGTHGQLPQQIATLSPKCMDEANNVPNGQQVSDQCAAQLYFAGQPANLDKLAAIAFPDNKQ